jgi:DNA-binding NtrC family response regulator
MNAHILVIDDDAEIRETVTLALTKSRYRVTAISDAAEAMETLADNPDISVVVTDVWMPGQTGVQLLKSLKALGAEAPRVVLMTGAGRQTPIEITSALGEMHGAVTTLIKPFGLADLRNAVATAIDFQKQLKSAK